MGAHVVRGTVWFDRVHQRTARRAGPLLSCPLMCIVVSIHLGRRSRQFEQAPFSFDNCHVSPERFSAVAEMRYGKTLEVPTRLHPEPHVKPPYWKIAHTHDAARQSSRCLHSDTPRARITSVVRISHTCSRLCRSSPRRVRCARQQRQLVGLRTQGERFCDCIKNI